MTIDPTTRFDRTEEELADRLAFIERIALDLGVTRRVIARGYFGADYAAWYGENIR